MPLIPSRSASLTGRATGSASTSHIGTSIDRWLDAPVGFEELARVPVGASLKSQLALMSGDGLSLPPFD